MSTPELNLEDEIIFESGKSILYRIEQGKTLLKVLNLEYPTPQEISKFYNEFEVCQELNFRNTREVIRKAKFKGRHCMYLSWIEAKPLSEVFKDKKGDVIDFLHIGIAITKLLEKLHSEGYVHRDINANNILIDLQKREAYLISFSLATKIDTRVESQGGINQIEGTLAYMSPEQTGRMNRVVDYRSDLYSLGITFFEMISGRLPFDSEDPFELVHSHLAVAPPLLHQISKTIPEVISKIIIQLLEKKAENRYQSAYGLRKDLENCLKVLEANGNLDDVELFKYDGSTKFKLPQKLYGREKELEEIHKKFDKAASGSLPCLMITGYSGTGKSVLVHEVYQPISARRGYFIEGKYDQFKRTKPYSAIIEAFDSFIDILLSEPKERFETIKSLIIEACGDEGKVLTDVLPKLELIIGTQPEVAEVGGAEARNRFNYIFRKFLTAITAKSHPIVLFIDDLQWADSSSLNLLQILLTDKDNGHLLCIGAFRDNEVGGDHPLIKCIEDIKSGGGDLSMLEVGNLKIDNINEWVSDVTNLPVAEVKDLAQLVLKKTQGNAFFTTQFLKSLSEDQLLYFNKERESWDYDLDKIKGRSITDNVVELIAEKAKGLPEETQKILQIGSCVGPVFGLDFLNELHQTDSLSAIRSLKKAEEMGLIINRESVYKFSHDRIQQAIFSMIDEEERIHIHYMIGQALKDKTKADPAAEEFFDMVNHYNMSRSLITDHSDLKQLTIFNLEAGKKAKESAAFDASFKYLENGMALILELEEKPWETDYDTTLALFSLAAEVSYLVGLFGKMDDYINEVLGNAKQLLDKVKPYEIRILAFKAENKLLDSINTGLEFLAQVGEKFPKKATLPLVMKDLVKTKFKLRNKTIEQLQDYPVMEDKEKLAAMRIIADIASSSYWATPNLFPLLIFRMVHMSLKYGNTDLSAFAYGSYGVIMCGVLGAMKQGYEYGKLSLFLLDKFGAKEWITQIYTPIYCLIINWNEHIDKTLKPLQESYHIGLETGAIEFACINTNIYCIHAYLSGKPLKRIEEEARAYSERFKEFKQETNFNYNEVYRQPMLNFLGDVEDPIRMVGEAYDEDRMLVQNQERNDNTGLFFLHFNKLILCYYFEAYDEAIKHAAESRKLLEAVLAKFEIPNHAFYETLTLLEVRDQLSGTALIKANIRIAKNIRQMKTWAKDAPENYLHKYFLMKAVLNSKNGNAIKAINFFDKAINGASENAFIHEEALAYELAAKHFVKQNVQGQVEYYLKSAFNAYREWGAEAKTRFLKNKYPQQLSGITDQKNVVKGISSTKGTFSGDLGMDLNTVLKSSAIISKEIVLDKLLRTLMTLVMENAGAERGFIIRKSSKQMEVMAASEDSGKSTQVLSEVSNVLEGNLSQSVVNYVFKSGKGIIVAEAQTDNRCSKDTYVLEKNPQSIMAAPIVNRGELTGLIYFENNFVSGAFTFEQLELLSLMSAQIGVALDNSFLYDQMEQKVLERTRELVEEKQKSDELLRNILPESIAQELKANGVINPKKFNNVTVLFTDFKGFTQLAETLPAEKLVNELDVCFSAFDAIVDKYGLEKIKTIGDSYMCVGGLPVENSVHAANSVKAALEFVSFMKSHSEKNRAANRPVFDLRIGLNTGPVIAGVVGKKKFVYDIWGDTVNIASRMESSGEIGRVNISEDTYMAIKDQFECEPRGEVQAKNKGLINMYFVNNNLK